jgi:hypothetical protein
MYCKTGKCPARGRVYHYDDRTAYKWQCCGSQKKEPDGHELRQNEASLSSRTTSIYCSVAKRGVSMDDLLINEYSYGTRYKWRCCGSQAKDPDHHSTKPVAAKQNSSQSHNTSSNLNANSVNTNASSSTSMIQTNNFRPVPQSSSIPSSQKQYSNNRARRTKEQDLVIYNRLGATCYLCKKKLPPFEDRALWHVEHIIPFSKRKDLDSMGMSPFLSFPFCLID